MNRPHRCYGKVLARDRRYRDARREQMIPAVNRPPSQPAAEKLPPAA